MPEWTPSGAGAARRRGLGRALVIGFAIVIASGFIIPYSENFMSSSGLMDSQFPLGVLLPFLFLVLIYNLAAKLISRRLVLRAEELLVVFLVSMAGIQAQDLIPRLIASIGSPYYYASAENRWPEVVWPHLPRWAIPSNDTNAVSFFFTGLPKGFDVPWNAWAPPLFWWLSFIGVIIFVCLCISVMLRKQWVVYERVEFPLARIPLQLARTAGENRLLPKLFRTGYFWVGFAIPAVLILWRVLSWYKPGLPIIHFGLDAGSIKLGRDYEAFYTRVNFFIIGFAYFTRLEILLSIWLFHVLGVLQAGISKGMGFAVESDTGYAGNQAQGGLVFFVLWGLWMARHHLKDVFRKAFRGAPEVDDSGEYLSYRTAVFGFLLGGVYIWVFLCKTGFHWGAAGLFLLASLVIYLGLAKIVAMSGLVYLRPTYSAQSTFRGFYYASDFGPGTVVGTSLMYAVRAGDRGYIMPPAMTMQAVAGEVRPRTRTVGKAILMAAILGMVLHAYSTVNQGYKQGAGNFQNYTFTSAGQYPYKRITSELTRTPRTTYRGRQVGFFTFGFLMTGLLTFLSYRVPWWPLHPVGFTISWGWPIFYSSLSVFIAWLAKTIILKIGGMKLYKRLQPLFIGLIVGHAFGVLVGLGADVISFPGRGHAIHGGDV